VLLLYQSDWLTDCLTKLTGVYEKLLVTNYSKVLITALLQEYCEVYHYKGQIRAEVKTFAKMAFNFP